MKVEYSVGADDYLNYYLYVASNSKQIKKQRQRVKLIVPPVYIGCAIILYYIGNRVMPLFFVSIAILWFFLSPLLLRMRYLKHYKGFIKENIKGKIGNITTIEIGDDVINSSVIEGKSTINTTAIEQIVELPTIVLIKLKTGQAFIFPKAKISDIGLLIVRLKALAQQLQVAYIIEDNWKWK